MQLVKYLMGSASTERGVLGGTTEGRRVEGMGMRDETEREGEGGAAGEDDRNNSGEPSDSLGRGVVQRGFMESGC